MGNQEITATLCTTRHKTKKTSIFIKMPVLSQECGFIYLCCRGIDFPAFYNLMLYSKKKSDTVAFFFITLFGAVVFLTLNFTQNTIYV